MVHSSSFHFLNKPKQFRKVKAHELPIKFSPSCFRSGSNDEYFPWTNVYEEGFVAKKIKELSSVKAKSQDNNYPVIVPDGFQVY